MYMVGALLVQSSCSDGNVAIQHQGWTQKDEIIQRVTFKKEKKILRMPYKHHLIATLLTFLLICSFNVLNLKEIRLLDSGLQRGQFKPQRFLALVTLQMTYVETVVTHFPWQQTWLLYYPVSFSTNIGFFALLCKGLMSLYQILKP